MTLMWKNGNIATICCDGCGYVFGGSEGETLCLQCLIKEIPKDLD